MSEKNLTIKYKCQHPSCQVFCKKGELTLEADTYKDLCAAYDEEEIFRSPKGLCRMGYDQPFKAVSILEEGSDTSSLDQLDKEAMKNDPIVLLIEEHKGVIAKLDHLEDSLRKRDIEALWIDTFAVENEIMRHSIQKEENALFPILAKRMPGGHAFMQIVHEDHKEFLSLLHSFRCSLQTDHIEDGLINSLMINLRNHIVKEDEEFFSLVEDNITDEDKVELLGLIQAIEKDFVPEVATRRSDLINSPHLENRQKLDFEIQQSRMETVLDDWSCH